MQLQKVADYLDTYNGRDKVMRILYYSAQYLAGITKSKELEHKLNIFSDQINCCRTVLRLFDDIPMLTYTLSYGLGRKEPDNVVQMCNVAVNTLDQLYYPLEHIAWAADCKLLSLKSDSWWTATSICWALSMYLMMIKGINEFSTILTLFTLSVWHLSVVILDFGLLFFPGLPWRKNWP
ncbi:peroxisomal biogenesis factor 11c isoform X2 [Rhodnius prolixus]|uniref:peroxisomal biogenesis factor 11c isoform X2 n=1 Tax=Rhodnius prolixus TaxID=13249 RepID=UPI003D188F11